jgi:hypothetical protein
MKKETSQNTETQLLELLKKVLPKATHDPQLAGKIYQAIESELKAKAQATAFDKFCRKVELPSLQSEAIEAAKNQLATAFRGADVTLKADRKEKTLAVEVALPDGTQLRNVIEVRPVPASGDAGGEEEVPAKFVPFPVCLPGDKELVWMLGKRETLSPEEAGIALGRLEEEFWASKTGQKLLRDRVERSFPEFMARVPGGMLGEAGLRRHYKEPEPVKMLRAKR